jgi:predicted nucleic acid-binding protein
MNGLDTGFFVRLLEHEYQARDVWDEIVGGKQLAAMGCLTLFEIDRLGLRGRLPQAVARTLVSELPILVRIVWLDDEGGATILNSAARLAHGRGLSMADAVILACLLAVGATKIYTTDRQLAGAVHEAEIVVL